MTKIFGDFDDILHNCFICELHHDTIQCRLPSEKALTYEQAKETAQGMEAAALNSKVFRMQNPPNQM